MARLLLGSTDIPLSFPFLLQRSAPFSVLLLTAAAAIGAGLGSCGDSGATGPSSGPVGPATGTGAGGAGGEGGAYVGGGDGRGLFEATVQPGLMQECGACHQLQGAADSPFLGAPDIYTSTVTYPGIVVPLPSQSIMLTRPADPGHGAGQAPNMSDELRAKVLAWLEVEAALIPDPAEGALVTTPFKPKLGGAFNSIYLGELGQEYENVSLTFNATELGAPPSMLLLENIELHPISEMQIHVVHPLFTAYAEGSEPVPDPSDSFSLIDDIFALDTQITLGTGTLVHTAWTKDAYLSIGFEGLELVGDFLPPIDCVDQAEFDANVAPALATCADNCHAGENAQAQGAMDLAKLDSEPAEACKQVRARIKPGNPDSSQILIVTNPLDPAVHLFKFQGSLSAYNSFKSEVSPWILAEDQ